MWVLMSGANGSFEVGFFRPKSELYEWYCVKTFDTYEEASKEVNYLNGGI